MVPPTLILSSGSAPPPSVPSFQTWDSTPLATQYSSRACGWLVNTLPSDFSKQSQGGGSPPPLGCGTWAWNLRPATLCPQISGKNLFTGWANEAIRAKKPRRGAESPSLEFWLPAFPRLSIGSSRVMRTSQAFFVLKQVWVGTYDLKGKESQEKTKDKEH